jgi:hypothetical protein
LPPSASLDFPWHFFFDEDNGGLPLDGGKDANSIEGLLSVETTLPSPVMDDRKEVLDKGGEELRESFL